MKHCLLLFSALKSYNKAVCVRVGPYGGEGYCFHDIVGTQDMIVHSALFCYSLYFKVRLGLEG